MMKAHFRYLSYVLRHKWFVLLAGLQTGAPIWKLLIHDWTKFLPVEWVAYVNQFYGPARTEPEVGRRTPWSDSRTLAFNLAWNHHQKANEHHWQYWLLTMDSGETFAMPMPEKVIREMVADWAGAGRAITGRWEVGGWYAKNRDRMRLHHDTRKRVDDLIHDLEREWRVTSIAEQIDG